MRTAAILLVVVWTGQLFAQAGQGNAFNRVFKPSGIELTADQKEKVDALQTEFVAQLRELQQRQNKVYTAEQRAARQEAVNAARQAGKKGQALRAAIEAAVKLTAEQKATLAAMQKERTALLQKAQTDVRALLTDQQRKKLQQGRRRPRAAAVKPTHADLKYGPAERNVMDVWLAKSEKPTPVLVSIHGGGFRGGNKSINPQLLRQCLESGISAVAITYRLSDEAIAPAQMLDSARAIQFIRHNAKQWNIDPKRIAATGGSAGAGISLWLGFHDDLADPDNEDPVLRQSTRLTCMYVSGGQTSYDPRFIREMFPDARVHKHPALFQLYDADLNKLDDLPKEKYELFDTSTKRKRVDLLFRESTRLRFVLVCSCGIPSGSDFVDW